MNRRRMTARLVVSVGLTVAATACSGDESDVGPVFAPADYRYPQDSLADARTFADTVLVVEVASERVDPPEFGESSGGLVGRTVTLEPDTVVWERTGATPVLGTLEVNELGFVVGNDGVRRPLLTDAVRLEVGRTYLVALMRVDGYWWTLPAVTAVVEGPRQWRLSPGLRAGHPLAALSGAAARDVGEAFRSTSPVVADGFTTDPDERFVEWIAVTDSGQDVPAVP